MKALDAIAPRARDLNLEFLLAGGHAVIAHGYARNTFDLDLIIRKADQEKWRQLAEQVGYKLYRERATFAQFSPEKQDLLPLDLMLVNEETFAKLVAQAAPAPTPTPGIRVVSLLHLLALKCHAIKYGHAGRIVKDADDVIRLVQANALDVGAPEFRELILKHGTTELYEKLQRVCRPS